MHWTALSQRCLDMQCKNVTNFATASDVPSGEKPIDVIGAASIWIASGLGFIDCNLDLIQEEWMVKRMRKSMVLFLNLSSIGSGLVATWWSSGACGDLARRSCVEQGKSLLSFWLKNLRQYTKPRACIEPVTFDKCLRPTVVIRLLSRDSRRLEQFENERIAKKKQLAPERTATSVEMILFCSEVYLVLLVDKVKRSIPYLTRGISK